MKKILPVPQTEIQRVPALTPSGRVSKTRTKWEIVTVANEQECESFDVAVNGKMVTVWIPSKYITEAKEKSYIHDTVAYTETGEKIMAQWRHGHCGVEVHEEPALFDWNKCEFVRVTDYCDGRVKDSNKYLLKVLY